MSKKTYPACGWCEPKGLKRCTHKPDFRYTRPSPQPTAVAGVADLMPDLLSDEEFVREVLAQCERDDKHAQWVRVMMTLCFMVLAFGLGVLMTLTMVCR